MTTFIVLSDTHFMVPGESPDMTWWNRMLKERSADIAESLVAAVKSLSPDFVIHCGDITDQGTPASFRFAKDTLERMGCPYYVTLGNHDTFQPGAREAISNLFENDRGSFSYARDIGGLRFVFLDCAWWIGADGREYENIDWDELKTGGLLGIGPSEDALRWLDDELSANTAKPAIVVAHTPIVSKPAYPAGSLPMAKPVKQTPSPFRQFASYCVRHDRLLRSISAARHVKAFLAGHWHIFDATRHEGQVHCQTGSLIEYPFEMRVVRVGGGRLSMTTAGLASNSFRDASYIDELNNGWVAGEPGDRTLEIDLE